MATHEASAEVRGEAAEVLDGAAAALSQYGFRVAYRGTTSIDLTGPASTRPGASSIRGASRIRLSIENGRLSLAAELDNAVRFGRSTALRIFGVALVTSALGAASLLAKPEQPFTWPFIGALFAGDVALWLYLRAQSPRGYEARTRKALDNLLAETAGG